MSEYSEIHVRIVTMRPTSCKVEIDDLDEPVWIPLSLIEDNKEGFKEGYEGPMYVQTWKLDQLEVSHD